jgi:PIN domain nuclease of toxin-antitoxin system
MQRLLLDTHTFLWWASDAPELSSTARKAISDNRNECFLSIASCWEMAIKSSLGKLRLSKPVDRFVQDLMTENGFRLLVIDLRHTAKVESMPYHHRDPFDRLLLAQAITEKLTIVSADSIFSDYAVKRLW